MPENGRPDPSLVQMFRSMRQDARSDPTPTELAETFVIPFGFDGAGSLPTVNQRFVMDLGQLKARITGAVITADAIGSCTIELKHGTFADLPNLSPIYSSASAIPTLSAAAAVVLDITTWTKYLQPADQLMATLKTVSGTGLTAVTLTLHCRRLKWTAGRLSVADTGGDTITDSSGNTVSLRS